MIRVAKFTESLTGAFTFSRYTKRLRLINVSLCFRALYFYVFIANWIFA